MGSPDCTRSPNVTVTPPDEDGYVTLRASDLVGMALTREGDGGQAVARLDDGFVVVEYPDRGRFHRMPPIKADTYIRIRKLA